MKKAIHPTDGETLLRFDGTKENASEALSLLLEAAQGTSSVSIVETDGSFEVHWLQDGSATRFHLTPGEWLNLWSIGDGYIEWEIVDAEDAAAIIEKNRSRSYPMQENNPDAPNPIRHMSKVDREGYYNQLAEKIENDLDAEKAQVPVNLILTIAKQSNLSPDQAYDVEALLESVMEIFSAYKGDE